jgi:hypothetical protein
MVLLLGARPIASLLVELSEQVETAHPGFGVEGALVPYLHLLEELNGGGRVPASRWASAADSRISI